ncbi:MAG: deiodinase-like protein [Gammaproteobacteria bacterium]|nr:deiodinase-like protein [Gammaproteobacteria bacterium]
MTPDKDRNVVIVGGGFVGTAARLLKVLSFIAAATFNSACAMLFPTEAGDSLAHFHDLAPRSGDSAPHFTLTDTAGNQVSLEQVIGDKPVVIQLGSYTCPVFRYRRFTMQPLRERYGDRVTFLVVYTQEAHPVGAPSPYRDEEWVPWINRLARINVGQPPDLAARLDQARFARQAMDANVRFLVDGDDDAVWRAYGAAPSPAFVLDRSGRVVLRQPWVVPGDIERILERLLSDQPP